MKLISEILSSLRPEYDFIASRDFISDGMLDSFDIVTLVSELERNYNVLISGTDIVPENFRSEQAIQELLKNYGVNL